MHAFNIQPNIFFLSVSWCYLSHSYQFVHTLHTSDQPGHNKWKAYAPFRTQLCHIWMHRSSELSRTHVENSHALNIFSFKENVSIQSQERDFLGCWNLPNLINRLTPRGFEKQTSQHHMETSLSLIFYLIQSCSKSVSLSTLTNLPILEETECTVVDY